ncbi:Nif3-like dinuclear metal center hexameric protein [Metabacillus sp. GX 13764]|uniref:Nif3-like dinuclear metal center hexameric protein n=1 Tax=Metabacillus kandeliae TaxID=2900151 RepID=UPI001E535EA4|nr:Nif3-like dinuclear metal center hexameric protein [Metabacillus kandeliae]MCD7033074.1 Nif3-like dinuclear metal center hexameric protein [Metabacillus kandeliae]
MSKTPNGYEVIQLFEKFSPKKYAVEGDKIGLQIGTLNKRVKNIMIALDVLEEVVDEAIEKQADLIIAHHPPIFRPLKTVQTDQPAGRILEKCIKNDIAVYAAHTNLDVAEGGVNDLLAAALGLTDTKILAPTDQVKLKKLAVMVPASHTEEVKAAAAKAGAGHIGSYSHCFFSAKGEGQFLPLEGTDPYIGEQGKLEKTEELKLETIFPEEVQRAVIQAVVKAHPYEEPAYDIYPLDNEGPKLGLGRIGLLEEEMTLQQFAEHVKKSLNVEKVRMVGKKDSQVKKVAVLGGDGNKYISHAKFQGADAFVTGDLYYHTAHEAIMMGLNVIDPGHNVEKVMKQGVTDVMLAMCEENNYEVSIFPSEPNTDPFEFI